jgi:hypothetical protein
MKDIDNLHQYDEPNKETFKNIKNVIKFEQLSKLEIIKIIIISIKKLIWN